MTLTEAAQDAIFTRIVDGARSTHPRLMLSPLEFVKFLSTINVVHHQRMAGGPLSNRPARLESYCGNSRDSPSLFQKQCRNVNLGCNYVTVREDALRRHEATCTRTSESAPSTKSFPCPHCPLAYTRKSGLTTHIRSKHDDYVPKACQHPRETCDPDIFPNKAEFDKYVKEHYKSNDIEAYQPAPCPVSGCTHDRVIPTSQALRGHLTRVHKFNAAQSRPHLRLSKNKSEKPEA